MRCRKTQSMLLDARDTDGRMRCCLAHEIILDAVDVARRTHYRKTHATPLNACDIASRKTYAMLSNECDTASNTTISLDVSLDSARSMLTLQDGIRIGFSSKALLVSLNSGFPINSSIPREECNASSASKDREGARQSREEGRRNGGALVRSRRHPATASHLASRRRSVHFQ